MSPKPWYENGLQFSCTRCGNCCVTHGEAAYIYLSSTDVDRLALHFGLSREQFLDQHCARDEDYTWLDAPQPACPYLDGERRCSVYEARPTQCRTWPFWKENLDELRWKGDLRAVCPGLDKGRRYTRLEIEQRALHTERAIEGEDAELS